ncbi:MAG: oligosaccharide flippase family protein [Actinomycetota bacterium]|nr:oligosaccharide flippase family protein [Actinomycetota bacterium]
MGVAPGPDETVDAQPRVAGARGGDYVNILAGTSQNVVGIAVAALATLGAQVLLTRTLGAGGFGIVTVATQAAFVTSFATRAGMDMAVLRDVAVDVGVGRTDQVRTAVSRAALIAGAVSVAVALAAWPAAGAIRSAFSLEASSARLAIPAALVGLPFIALTNVWLAATRGLKIMRYTLYVFWAGQPIGWIGLTLLFWTVSRSPAAAVLAYSASWVVASVAAFVSWRIQSRRWTVGPIQSGWLDRLVRYAGPRAPAALFSQLLFWADLFVVTRYVSDADVGIYSAALRAGQIVVLFLTSVNLMFSPYVADLHNRGEIARLDRLYKTLTRWTIAATLPAFLLLAVAPGTALKIFGGQFSGGEAALLILLGGQLVNIATGSAGFVLIMVGRTGWDFVVYLGSLAFELVLAFIWCPRYGIEGAAAANAVTFALSNAARLLLVKRFVDIQPYDMDYIRLVLPAGAALATMVAAHALISGGWAVDLAATAVAGAVVYVVAYLVVGLTSAERAGATRLLRTFRGNSPP